MMRKILVLFLVTGIGLQAYCQEKWDLQKCVEYALEHNISIRQADIQARLAELQFNQSKLSQYPSANLSGNTGLSFGRSIDPTSNEFTTTQLLSAGFSFSTGVNLFNWFSQRNTIAGDRLNQKASDATVDKLKSDVALNVANAFLLVVVAREQINIAQVAVEQSKQNYENTRKRVDAGDLPELNLAEIETQLANDSATLINANSTLLSNILQLKAVLSMDAAMPFEVEIPPVDDIPVLSLGELQPDAVYDLALANLPEQRVNEFKLKAAEKYADASKGAMYPTLSLGGSIGTNYANNQLVDVSQIPTGSYTATTSKVNVNGTDYNVLIPNYNTTLTTYRTPFGTQFGDNLRESISLQLNVPIFNGGSARTAWQRSKLNIKDVQLQNEQSRLTLKQNIYSAYNDAVTAVQNLSSARKGATTAEKAYNFAQKRYDLGLLSTIDLLTNQNNLTSARLQLAVSRVNYVFALKLLEFYKGQGIRLK